MTMMISTYPLADGVTSEQLRARSVGEDYFVVDSVPFVDQSLAMGDLVECVGGVVVNVVARGGNSTLRLLPHPGCPDVVSPLMRLGCQVEEGPAGLLGVSVPADAPLEGIATWLEELAEQQLIEVAPGFTAGA